MKNTSLTIADIENLRMNQLEDLLIGLGENAEKEAAELRGDKKNEVVLEGDDAIAALLGMG